MKNHENTLYCAWCGEPIPCSCGYNQTTLPKPDWKRIFKIFPKGMPSCGLTDARRLGSTGKESGTTYIGKK